MKTELEELIEELKERKAFLEFTDCISESLEVEYIIELCKKNQKVDVANYVKVMKHEMESLVRVNITDIHTSKQIDVLH